MKKLQVSQSGNLTKVNSDFLNCSSNLIFKISKIEKKQIGVMVRAKIRTF